MPGNISSIRPQCAACENLIKAALIRPDETLSHFSPHWEPTFKKVPLQMLCEPAGRLHLPIFAGHCFKEFLLCFKPLLLSTLAGSVFCLVQDGRGLFCGVARWQKMGFATWQLVLLVAKSDPYLPRTVARVVRTAGGLIRTVFSYRGKETLDNQNQIYILKIVFYGPPP